MLIIMNNEIVLVQINNGIHTISNIQVPTEVIQVSDFGQNFSFSLNIQTYFRHITNKESTIHNKPTTETIRADFFYFVNM